MIPRNLLLTTAVIASVGLIACSDTTAPKNEATTVNPSAVGRVVKITFTKWIAAYPAMTGFTSYGANTFAGEVLSLEESKNGVILRLQARYEVTDPSGSRSFKAVIKGKQNNKTGRAVLNGVITEGWRIGARVHVTYQVITPCPQSNGEADVCFQGTIRIRGEGDEGDED
jgi:hypothetical protein